MIPLIKQEWILSLLEDGLSIHAIAARTGVSRNTVSAIKKKSQAKRCPTCGVAVKVLPCVECQSAKIPAKKRKVRNIKLNLVEAYLAEAPELFRIVDDLRSLYELDLIKHHLFIDLGKRARNSLNRIFPPIGKKDAKKKKATE